MGVARALFRGTMYFAIAKYSSLVINIIVTMILSRLLQPADFGVVAIATAVIAFFDILSNAGIVPAIIQNKKLDEVDYSNIYSFTIYFSIILLIVFILIAYWISLYYYKNIQLLRLLLLLSIQLLFSTLNLVPNALLLKEQQFKSIAIIQISGVLISGVISVLLAFKEFGVYSIVVTPIFTSFVNLVSFRISLKAKLKLSFRPATSSLKKIIGFSIYQFCFNIINYFSRNLDKILIGRYLGMATLGLYEKSYRLMMLPISNLTNVVSPTLQPVLSNYQDKKEIICRTYIDLSKILLVLGSVISPLFFWGAEELIYLFFGPQWNGAVMIFKILSLSIFFQLLDSLSGSILQSTDRPKKLFYSGLLSAIVNIMALVIGILCYKSIKATSILLTLSYMLNLMISFLYIGKVLNVSFINFTKIFFKPIILVFVLFLMLFYFDSYFNIQSNVVSLLIKIVIILLVSCLYYCYVDYVPNKEYIKTKVFHK